MEKKNRLINPKTNGKEKKNDTLQGLGESVDLSTFDLFSCFHFSSVTFMCHAAKRLSQGNNERQYY
jgi:hypothetical protein